MTIACTRCGATEDGNIISAPIAFAFKHEKGCAHGVGPLAVLPSGFKKKPEKKDKSETIPPTPEEREPPKDVHDTQILTNKTMDETKEDIKVEESKPKKSVKEKIKVFGKREKSDA